MAMIELPFTTVELHAQLDRWRAGDRDAADELCRRVAGRLELLARKLIGRFPNVRPLADTGDVLQTGLVRLLRTLGELRPATTGDFFNLAAVHLRRELLDLTRRVSVRPSCGCGGRARRGGRAPPRVAGPPPDEDDLDRWCRFHEAVERLPVLEREVIGLAFYHGWTQRQMAELFRVDERTIRRRWRGACSRLHEVLDGELPSPTGPE